MNTARASHAGVGADNTTALAIFGFDRSPNQTGKTEQWNGSSWTEVADANTDRIGLGAAGITTSALAWGGYSYPAGASIDNTEQWNGSVWTEVNDLNTARAGNSNAGAGTVSAALAFGGDGLNAQTEEWNGYNWVEVADLSTARSNHGGVGTSTAAIAFGGQTPPVVATTEEWNGSSNTIKVLTD